MDFTPFHGLCKMNPVLIIEKCGYNKSTSSLSFCFANLLFEAFLQISSHSDFGLEKNFNSFKLCFQLLHYKHIQVSLRKIFIIIV